MSLVEFGRRSSAKSCRALVKPSEIEVLPPDSIALIPASISAASYDHCTRVVASAAKETTANRAASSPRVYSLTYGWHSSSIY